MMTFFIAALIILFPVALHGMSLLGRWILDPIQSPSKTLNQLFNSYPLILSLMAGLFGAGAFLLRKGGPAFYACIIVAVICFLVDMYACLLSFFTYVSRKR